MMKEYLAEAKSGEKVAEMTKVSRMLGGKPRHLFKVIAPLAL